MKHQQFSFRKFGCVFLTGLVLSCIVVNQSGVLAQNTPQAANTTAAIEAPNSMQLFLLVGQSNMAGRGKVEPQDEVTHPRIWMLNKDLKWTLAKDPLHFDKPIAGVGLASEFARVLAKSSPDINIGLIPCAVGGTNLDQWSNPRGTLYKDAIMRAREALNNGKLAGILWNQGESDSAPARVETYPARLSALFAQFRKDLDAPNVPIIVGEIGRFRPDQDAFNAMLPNAVAQIPNSALVSAEGLEDKGDKLHFGSAALRTFGQRYAAEYLKLKAANTKQ
jgi:hypothetical protein